MTPPEINAVLQYVTPDGRLTPEGLRLFARLLDVLRDHEARITTLEP